MSRVTDHKPLGGQRSLLVDEWMEWLVEGVRDVPMFGPHLFQVIRVRRGEYWCDFEKNLGPLVLFPTAHGFRFWGAGFYSVGEAMEIADRARENKMPEEREPTDLLGEYKKQLDELGAQKAHRTVSGRSLTIVRG